MRYLFHFTVVFATILVASFAWGHPGGHSRRDSATEITRPRIWSADNGTFLELGSFAMARQGIVQIRRRDDSLVNLPLERLSKADRDWVAERVEGLRRFAELENTPRVHAQPAVDLERLFTQARARRPENDMNDKIAETVLAAFDPFARLKAITTRADDRYVYVDSNGIPAHPMMIGITAWQQQVPIPQKYTGDNAWRIPVHPVPAEKPVSAKNRFLRGAIALAVNGVPIFNPLNNRGDDAFLFGELDEYGGHCGRADDYHYHIAPVHLEKTVGNGKPIAYALDGYPIYGYEEPDGSPVKNLDALNGHKDAEGNYHYHATKTYPYLNGGFYGEVVERDGQVDPQPRAESLRPALQPLRGAKIVDFVETIPGSYKLTYEVGGKKGTVGYSLTNDGGATFEFVDPSGRTSNETYAPRRRGPEGGKGKRPPPPPPPRRDEAKSGETASSARPVSKLPQLAVTSKSIDDGGFLSVDCTCDGAGHSPAVEWKDAPAGTKLFAVSLWHTAPDQEKSYWVVYNIPADVDHLDAKSLSVGKIGVNDRRRTAFDPMCSKGPGVKVYHLTVFALSKELDLPPERASRAGLLAAIKGITLAEGTLDFKYERMAGK